MTQINDYSYTTDDQLKTLIETQNFPPYILESLNDHQEYAHLRYFENSCCIIFNYPHLNHQHIVNTPICLVVQEEHLNFIHPDHVTTLFVPADQALDLPQLIAVFNQRLLKHYEGILASLENSIQKSEADMLRNPEKDNIKHLFKLKKMLIKIQMCVTGVEEVSQYIIQHRAPYLYHDDLNDEYGDIAIETKQVRSTLVMLNEAVDSILDITGTLQANRLNKTMKTLTAITLVISIPTLVTSFYGMNIDLPFQQHPQSLLIVSIGSFLLTLAVVIYLIKKNLL